MSRALNFFILLAILVFRLPSIAPRLDERKDRIAKAEESAKRTSTLAEFQRRARAELKAQTST
jgi:F0F1-type ATP synthase membrane subunit b/b'